MFKLPYICTHLICQQSNAQNSPSLASTYRNHELPDAQDGFRKGRGIRGKIANICWIIEKAREFQKNIYCHSIYYAKVWLCESQQTVEKSSRDGNTRPSYLPPQKSVCRSRSNSQNQTWNNKLVIIWGWSMSTVCILTLLCNFFFPAM